MGSESGMKIIFEIAGWAIYASLASAAIFGLFCVILLLRRVNQKRFASDAAAGRFLDEVSEELRQRNYDAIGEMCDSPPYWSKAVPQLILVALENRGLGVIKLRRLLGERFEREVLADFEYRASWVATVVKSAPMLGLLGTVVGMISAFKEIASQKDTGLDPGMLASDISFALFTTAIGLTIAIPLVMAGNMISIRIGKLQDSVQDQLGQFVEDLDASANRGGGQS